MLLLTVGLVAGCFLLGQGVLALCGSDRWRWWAPALGYAVLLIVGGQVLRVPNHDTEMVVIVLVAALATLAFAMVRRACTQAAPYALPLALAVILIAAIPFFATGRTGILGPGVSNDMSTHLTAAFYLRTGDGMRPAAAFGGNVITTGYPLGAQGLAALLTYATGLGEENVFSAITLTIPVLTAFAALGIVPTARREARWALAAIVGLGYLLAAYFAQDSFKETTQALFVLATALALGDLAGEVPPRGWRRGVPIGLLAAGSVYNYSYGGMFWMIGAAGVFLIVEAARRPRALFGMLRQAIVPAAGCVVALAIVLAPEITRIEEFTKSIFGVEPTTQHGNLFHAVNPLEAVGPWFSGDFRITPRPEWPSLAFSALGLAALLVGLVWWWRRRALVLPATLLASIAIWVELALTRNTYNAAKGLVVMAPLVMACIGAPLAAAWGERSRVPRTRRLLQARRALGAVLLGAAVVATFSALRSAPVGLGPHERELASMRPLVRGKAVLFLANDHFAQWELRGARLYVTTPLYVPAALPMHPQKPGGRPLDGADIDNYESGDLDKMDFIVTPGGAYRSEIPPNFQLVRRTASYELYHRSGPTPVREPLEPVDQPGAVFDCARQPAKKYLSQYRWAGVLPTPFVSTEWQGSIGVPGHTATMRVSLPRGRWDVSLEYISFTGLVVRGPQLDKAIAPNYGLIAEYWPAGTLTSTGRPFTLSVTSEKRPWFGRLLGAPRSALTADTPGLTPLWRAAFTRHGAAPQRIAINRACGRYVDWFAPAGSTMH
jgi:hypothetical protein